MSLDRAVVRFLEHTTQDRKCEQGFVVILFPTLVLLQELITHVGRDAGGSSGLLTALVLALYAVLNEVRGFYEGRIGASLELKCGNRQQRELDVRGITPRIRLFLGELKG